MSAGLDVETDQRFEINQLSFAILSNADAADLYRCLSDPVISEWIYWLPKPFTMADATALIGQAQNGAAAKTEFLFAVRRMADHSYVGNINIHHRDAHEMEIGYWLDKKYWDQGLATEMVSFAAGFAAKIPDIKSLFATTSLENTASQKLLEKSGFKFEKKIVSAGAASVERTSNLYRKSLV